MLRLLAAASMAGVLPATLARDAEPTPHVMPEQLRLGSEQIAILVYPEFTALDALGPHYFLSGMMGATVRFIAKTRDPVVAEGASLGGFQVKPHLTLADCPAELDLLLVPGGLTARSPPSKTKRRASFSLTGARAQNLPAVSAPARCCSAQPVS